VPGVPKPGRRRKGADPNAKVQTFRSPTAAVVWVVWLLFAVGNWIDLAVQGRDHLSAVAAALLLLVTGIAYATAQRPKIIADEAGVTVRNPLRDYRIGWAGVTKVDLADLLRVHCDWGARDGTGPGAPGRKKTTKTINVWAVHYSRRRQLAAESKARRASRPRRASLGSLSSGGLSGGGFSGRGGFSGGGGLFSGGLSGGPAGSVPASAAEAEAEKIARILGERATAAQAETVWAAGTVPIAGQPQPAPLDPAVPLDPASTLDPANSTGAIDPQAVTSWLEPLQTTWSRNAIAAILIPALILLIVCLL
jgi:uncharacterized membrane protein YgcG